MEGCRCYSVSFYLLPQRKATAAQTFEWVTLPRVSEGLVHFGAQLVARGWGRRRHSRRHARARAQFKFGVVPESKGHRSPSSRGWGGTVKLTCDFGHHFHFRPQLFPRVARLRLQRTCIITGSCVVVRNKQARFSSLTFLPLAVEQAVHPPPSGNY